mgnify:CR=1 FL=1
MKSCSVSDGLAIFKALGSPVRVQILRLIQEREGLNIKQIAQNLKIPVTTLSPHLNLLAEAGLIEFRDESLSHGTQKRCYFIKDWDQLLVNMALYGPDLQTYSAEIGVGHFSDFSVTPVVWQLLLLLWDSWISHGISYTQAAARQGSSGSPPDIWSIYCPISSLITA